MARERWFYAPTHKRQGPVALAQLVEGLLSLPDPRVCLVWKHGLPAWTPAGEVAEVDRHLAPFVIAKKPATSSHAEREIAADARTLRGEAGSERARARAGGARAAKAAGPSPLVYAGAGAGLVALGVLVWLFWPKAPGPRPKTAAGGDSPGVMVLNEGGSGTGGTEGTGAVGASPGQAGFAGWSDEEKALPPAELGKLNSIAAWSDKAIEVTLYNGSNWRITQLSVTTSRLVKDDFVAGTEVKLLPVGIPADEGVDHLMDKVAPNRRKPGVNPLDTGKFVGQAGNRPEAFRAPITGAMGYPPK